MYVKLELGDKNSYFMATKIRNKKQKSIHFDPLCMAKIERNRLLNETFTDCVQRLILSSSIESSKRYSQPSVNTEQIKIEFENLESSLVKIISALVDNTNELKQEIKGLKAQLESELKRNTDVTSRYTEALNNFANITNQKFISLENLIKEQKKPKRGFFD